MSEHIAALCFHHRFGLNKLDGKRRSLRTNVVWRDDDARYGIARLRHTIYIIMGLFVVVRYKRYARVVDGLVAEIPRGVQGFGR